MSKNTGTSELINYFDLGANGDVGIAGSLDVNTIANATTDTDKFLVSDTGIIKYRTGAELLSDIGAAPAVAGGYVPYTGATTNVDLGIYNITAHTIRATGSANNAGQINLRSDAIFSLVNGYGTIGSGTTNQFNFYQTTGAGVFRGAIFSLNSITASATRTFTLPDADGTIALTSSLSGYLPLTGGTLTGALNGTSASFTGNIITSAGFFNFGNNYGIQARNFQDTAYRTIFKLNTSNQVEIGRSTDISDIILGTASATNALTITSTGSATFSSSVGINGVYSPAAELQVGKSSDVTIAMSNYSSVTSGIRGGIAWYNSSVSTVANIRAVAVTDNVGTELQFYTRPAAGSLTQVLTLASTGAATFSSSVTSDSLVIANNDARIRNNDATGRIILSNSSTNTFAIFYGTSHPTQANQTVFANGGVTTCTFSSTGAATFSSSVTANSLKAEASGAAAFLYFNNTASPASNYIALGSAANELYFHVNGTNSIVIKPNSNVLIGTLTDSGQRLQVNGATRILDGNVLTLMQSGNGNGSNIRSVTNGDFRVTTGGTTDALTITNGGNVGIGTTIINSERLTVAQTTANASALLVYTTGVTAGQSYGATIIGGTNSSDASFRVFNQGAGTNYFHVRGDGNVGIGTASPSSKLEVATTSTAANVITISNSSQRLDLGVNDSAGGSFIFASLNRALRFGANDAEKMRITDVGYLQLSNDGNYIAPGSPYHQIKNTAATMTLYLLNHNAAGDGLLVNLNTNGTDYHYFRGYSNSAGGNRVIIYSNGNIQNANNSYGALSDIKLKENIEDATPKLNDLMKVKIRNYNLIGENTKQLGVIAQELEEIFPAMIDESPDKDKDGNYLGTTTKSVKYSVFVPMLIKAIQEQQQQIDKLKNL